MKRLQLLTICLMLSALAFAQNQSLVPISNPISPQPTLPLGEVFRFDEGLVTQLDDFTPPSGPMDPLFSFDDSRWFSIGRLQTSQNQAVYGLRFQLPNRALTYGYQDIDDDNPRIQWIDDRDNPGNLEFRVADDFMSTNSDLVATFTSKRVAYFSSTSPSQNYDDARVFVEGKANRFGTFSTTTSNEGTGFGISGFANNNGANVGVFGRNPGDADSQFEYAIYGVSGGSFDNNEYAGFFDGDVNVTGTVIAGAFQIGSDKKLKRNIKETEDVLEKLSRLKSYTFNYKNNKFLSLPSNLQHGFIAQEIEKVYPEFVQKATYSKLDKNNELVGTGSYKTVNYIGLISELTAAVNELNQKVEDLKASKTTLVYSSQFTEEELAKIKANGYQLEQNIPNPFSGVTSIQYSLPENEPQASIMIFDLSGKLVNSYKLKERNGQLRVNQSDLGESGMYLYSLFAGGKEIMTKRMLVK